MSSMTQPSPPLQKIFSPNVFIPTVLTVEWTLQTQVTGFLLCLFYAAISFLPEILPGTARAT